MKTLTSRILYLYLYYNNQPMALHKRTLNQAVEVVESLKENHITSFHQQRYLYRLIEDIKFPRLINSHYYNRPGSPRANGGNAYTSQNFETIIRLLINGKILTKDVTANENGINTKVSYTVNQKAVSEFLKVFGPKYKNY